MNSMQAENSSIISLARFNPSAPTQAENGAR